MSPFLLQIFAAMVCTFALGLTLGWVVWRFGGAANADDDSTADFWRSKLEQSRNEFWREQAMHAELKEEHSELQDRISTLESAAAK